MKNTDVYNQSLVLLCNIMECISKRLCYFAKSGYVRYRKSKFDVYGVKKERGKKGK